MELQHIENGRKRLADLLGALDEEDKQRDRSLDPAGYLWLSVIANRWHVAPTELAGILPFLIPSPPLGSRDPHPPIPPGPLSIPPGTGPLPVPTGADPREAVGGSPPGR